VSIGFPDATAANAARGDIGSMRWPIFRSQSDALRALVIGVALCWSVAFVVVALVYRLELYADGAMFSYAVAVRDVWAFHWHNISGRMSVFLLTLLPAELFVRLSGDPSAGVSVYGLLFYVGPLAGLIGTFAADRSIGRIIFVYACCSTALLCPLIFGFPTEMWLAHAMFWPTLAVSHYAKHSVFGTALVFAMFLTLAFTHEGALVLEFSIVATLAMRGLRDALFLRSAAILTVVLIACAAVKMIIPPDEYYAGVLLRAALHFFDLKIFEVNVVGLLFGTMVGYGVLVVILSRLAPDRGYLYAAAMVVVLLSIYWFWFDHSIHASSRYYLRTALVILTPTFGALSALLAIYEDGRLAFFARAGERVMNWLKRRKALPLAAAFMLLTLVHVVETGKFVTAWTHYSAAVAALATGDQSGPGLGDARFVSSERIPANLNRLSWFSTTPYLSVLLVDFKPKRLVVDPNGNYFWLSCATATANEEAARAVPAETRDLVRIYSCLHRS
jgi:hypothetical protein